MNKEKYEKMLSFWRKTTQREKIVTFLCKNLPRFVMTIYFVGIIYFFYDLILGKSDFLLPYLIIPFISLMIITFVRDSLNFKRPYDIYDITPMLGKKNSGRSFPSRHAASAFVIATTFCYYNIYIGVAVMILAVLVAISRVMAGVHFIKDVVMGAVSGIMLTAIFFSIYYQIGFTLM